MKTKPVSRRQFAGAIAAALGLAGLPETAIFAQAVDPAKMSAAGRVTPTEYDGLIKICFNENPYGPTRNVLEAMTGALKYANRYNAPDDHVLQAIAAHHNISPENILLGSGSTEILQIAAEAFLAGGKKVIGAEPTFGSVYEYATGLNCDAIKLPLRSDFSQDIEAIIQAAKDHRDQLGMVYLCNPNNPTGLIVKKDEVRRLLDGLPEGVPVLIDEAYHHFVDNPDYATSVPCIAEGRPVLVTRTFSKIAALAGMRLGYGLAPSSLIERLRPYYDIMSVNALVKWGGAVAIADLGAQQQVKHDILQTRRQTTEALESMGHKVIPSDANFFMVHLGRDVRPVIQAFRQRGILVGRPFPPMLEHLRVSVGAPDEMSRFLAGFKEIMV